MKMHFYELLDNPRKTVQVKRKFCFILFGILFGCALIFHLYVNRELVFDRNIRVFTFQNKFFDLENTSQVKPVADNFLIKQKGCRIPAMFTFGSLVNPFLEKTSSVRCDIREERIANGTGRKRTVQIWEPALFYDEGNTLYVDQAALKHYGGEELKCEYQEFFRTKPPENTDVYYNDGDVTFADIKNNLHLTKPTNISMNTEFIRVECHKAKKLGKKLKPTYKDYFAFVPLKNEVERRCEETEKNRSSDGVNVMIIALDALSRLNFRRQMILSAHYLKKQLGGIEMLGYNKVGDNTFPNFVPAFSGLSAEELKKTCWLKENHFFDKCSFVWQEFQRNGFRTNFAEDSGSIGVFNYIKNGFREQPTDYYLRPFNIQSEFEIGHTKPANCFLCLGGRLNLTFLLNYALKFGERFRDKRYFGLFWSNSFTHDFFNLSPQGDNALLKFLEYINRNNLLNNTVLIFLSDHGLRWGSFRETFQGHLEERLPMLWFVFPKWFEKKYQLAVQNLRRNVDKLTTPFDLYETLNDLANLTRIENTEIELRSMSEYANHRQASLFLPVSPNRTCFNAGIPIHYCTCHNDVKSLKTNDSSVIKGANVIVEHINEELNDHDECSKLNLKSVDRASMEPSTMNEKFDANFTTSDFGSNFVITITTSPGDGVFEATVRYEATRRKFLVIGSVSRINTYGSQGNCVKDYILRLYCYCKNSESFM